MLKILYSIWYNPCLFNPSKTSNNNNLLQSAIILARNLDWFFVAQFFLGFYELAHVLHDWMAGQNAVYHQQNHGMVP